MTNQEIIKIKQYQKEYQNLFGKRLEIDFSRMKGIRKFIYKTIQDIDVVSIEDILDKCAKKFDADLNVIRNREKRLHYCGQSKERLAVQEFAKIIIDNGMNVGEAAKAINRDRTLLYHYAGKGYLKYEINL